MGNYLINNPDLDMADQDIAEHHHHHNHNQNWRQFAEPGLVEQQVVEVEKLHSDSGEGHSLELLGLRGYRFHWSVFVLFSLCFLLGKFLFLLFYSGFVPFQVA